MVPLLSLNVGGLVLQGWGRIWGHVDFLGFIVALHLVGLELGVHGGLPLPPALHPINADGVGVLVDEDVPLEDEGIGT